MAWFALARVLFVAAVAYSAALLHPLPFGLPANIAFGLILAAAMVALESRLRETSVTHVLGALIGGTIGLVIARTIGLGLFWADTGDPRVVFLHSFILIVLPYLGLVLGGKHGDWLEPARLVGLFRTAGPERRYKILDTSVIIDGRVADVCETGFVDGTLVIPQFVLKELQLVADSADSLKRNRGRRGLDILQKIQKMSGVVKHPARRAHSSVHQDQTIVNALDEESAQGELDLPIIVQELFVLRPHLIRGAAKPIGIELSNPVVQGNNLEIADLH